jgi:broad specificity phosphatase PhoE
MGERREVRSSGSRQLRAIRHAESEWNVTERIQGQTDQSLLTEKGHIQANALRKCLQGEQFQGQHLQVGSVAAIISSDLRRAVQTAIPLGDALGLPVHLDPRLRERSFGVLEGQPKSALTPAFSGIVDEQVVDAECRPPGGESITDLWCRAASFLRSLAAALDRGDVVVVVHGGTLRALRACLFGIPPASMTWTAQPNCTIQRFDLPSSEGLVEIGSLVTEGNIR